jgi:hypothetical protein
MPREVYAFISCFISNTAFLFLPLLESVLLIKDLGVQLQTLYTSGREESEVS